MNPPTCQQCGQPITGNTPGDGLCASCIWVMLHGAEHAPTVAAPAPGLPEIPGHEIVEELARGGMGIVYRARQKEPHREVAIKMLLPFDNARHDVRERFQVEINALADLDHPGILPLYQVGTTDGRPWFSMKLATGGSLATRLKRNRKPSDPQSAAKLMAAMADAVHHAHSHGVAAWRKLTKRTLLRKPPCWTNRIFSPVSAPAISSIGIGSSSSPTPTGHWGNFMRTTANRNAPKNTGPGAANC